jgi:hypothetical protein
MIELLEKPEIIIISRGDRLAKEKLATCRRLW